MKRLKLGYLVLAAVVIGGCSDERGAGVAEHAASRASALEITQQAKLTAAESKSGDNFGISVGLSGDSAIVGAYTPGAAYAFVRQGDTWSEQGPLIPEEAAQGLGLSVAIEGDTAVLGAWQNGAAYVFARDAAAWQQHAKLTATKPEYAAFGISVAIAGSTVVVGSRGAAYVFIQEGTEWQQQAKLLSSDAPGDDRFGAAVSISGDTILVGISSKYDNGEAAYVFQRNGGEWSPQAKLSPPAGADGSGFGVSVAISNNVALVGAPASSGGAGAAHVFVRSEGVWLHQETLTPNNPESCHAFGFPVSLSGATAVIGAAHNPGATGTAHVFERKGALWSHAAVLTAGDGLLDDDFGRSVVVEGSTVIVGRPTASSAFVYALDKGLGESCSQDSECPSGHCVDGVCCDTECGGGILTDCVACSVGRGGAVDGTCGPVICESLAECRQPGTCEQGTCTSRLRPDGTPCSGGTCRSGGCFPSSQSSAEAGAGATADHASVNGGGCGCHTAGRHSASIAWMGLGIAALMAARRRRHG